VCGEEGLFPHFADVGMAMKRDESIFIVVLMAFFVFMLFNSLGLHQIRRFGEMGSGFWPILILSLAVLLSLVLLFGSFLQYRKEKSKTPKMRVMPGGGDSDLKNRRKKLALSVIFLLIYILLMSWIGFLASTLLYVFAFIYALEERRKPVLFLSPFLVTAIVVVVFAKFLGIPLPKGVGVFAALSRLFY